MFTVRISLLTTILIAGLAGSASQAERVIRQIDAGEETITLHMEQAAQANLELLALPPYPLHQEWSNDGFGGALDFTGGCFVMDLFDPAPDPFDPFLTHPRIFSATDVRYVNVRLRFTNAPGTVPCAIYHFAYVGGSIGVKTVDVVPTGSWQTVSLDLASSETGTWEGLRTIRLDLADAETPNVAAYVNTSVEIDWITVTAEADLVGDFPVEFGEAYWKFDYRAPVYSGHPSSIVQIPRYLGERDLLYARFQFLEATTHAPWGDHAFATHLDGLLRQGPVADGWRASGFGQTVTISEAGLEIDCFDPAPNPFDPHISNNQVVPATDHQYLVVRMSLVNAPPTVPCAVYWFPQDGSPPGSKRLDWINLGFPQTVAFDLTTGTGSAWAGNQRLRFDLADGLGVSGYENTGATIQWIALTNNSSFDPASPAPDDIVWDFYRDNNNTYPEPETVKGLQIWLVDDAIELGIKSAGYNIVLNALIDLSGNAPLETWEVDGYPVPINSNYVAVLDSILQPLNDNGIGAYCILLFLPPKEPNPGNPLIHPHTDLENNPNFTAAFNLTDEMGYRLFRAGVEYLAHRYGNPENKTGWMRGLIVGNEVNSHWYWHNMGEVPVEEVVDEYELQVRISDLALRRTHSELQAYVSLEHNWERVFDGNLLHSAGARTIVDLFAAEVQQFGDFPWAMAFHPYPEDLTDCRFWLDTTAPMTYDAQRITFKNVEVLESYMRQPELLYDCQARPIIFSEQGLNTPGDADGQKLQAGAYAYTYQKISQMSGVNAYLYFSHIDVGPTLHLGLWTEQPPEGSGTADSPKLSYDVFKYADTPQWQTYADPYLSFTGLSSWADAAPERTLVRFEFDSDMEGWEATNQLDTPVVGGSMLTVQATGNDPFLTRDGMFFGADNVDVMQIRMAVSGGNTAELFWSTNNDPFFGGGKSQQFSITGDGAFHSYTVDLSSHAEWVGEEIRSLRLDPTEDSPGATIQIDSIRGYTLCESTAPAASTWMLR